MTAQREAFFLPLPPAADRYLPSWRRWSRSTFLPGVRGYLPRLCPTALRQCPLLFNPRPASTFQPRGDKSRTLLDWRARAARSAHSLHSCTFPCRARGFCAEARPCRQTEQCVRGRVDKHVPFWARPHFNVFIQEDMQLCCGWMGSMWGTCDRQALHVFESVALSWGFMVGKHVALCIRFKFNEPV